MAIGVDGRIGVLNAGSSAPSTLPAYLASIGKNSWYARFIAGTNMWTGATLNGSAASLNGTVGSWGVDSANTSNFSAYWTQASAGDRPYYQAANGVNSLYAPTNDHASLADTRHMQLSSTTALNGTYSLLIRVPYMARDTRWIYSHNGTHFGVSSTAGSNSLFTATSNNSAVMDQIACVVRNTAGTSSGNALIGITQSGTGHNNSAPYLLKRLSQYSSSGISEIWLMPALTANELDAAMTFVS